MVLDPGLNHDIRSYCLIFTPFFKDVLKCGSQGWFIYIYIYI